MGEIPRSARRTFFPPSPPVYRGRGAQTGGAPWRSSPRLPRPLSPEAGARGANRLCAGGLLGGLLQLVVRLLQRRLGLQQLLEPGADAVPAVPVLRPLQGQHVAGGALDVVGGLLR